MLNYENIVSIDKLLSIQCIMINFTFLLKIYGGTICFFLETHWHSTRKHNNIYDNNNWEI